MFLRHVFHGLQFAQWLAAGFREFEDAWSIQVAKITGQVVSVTNTGDLITDISVGDLEAAPRDNSVTIKCEGHMTAGIWPTDHQQPEMTFVAFEGESGFVELSLVGDNASLYLGIKSGSKISLSW